MIVTPDVDLPDVRAIVLTPSEYEALPPNRRHELVDGVLHVMNSPTTRHQVVVDRLHAALGTVVPAGLYVAREQEIRLADDHRRIPDLLVVPTEAVELDGNSYLPDEVILAIEVTSPGTETVDRLHKPAEYAEAGVARFWRVEPKPTVVVHTYRLGEDGRYMETGRFGRGDQVDVPGLPWARFAVSDLSPERA